MNVFCSLIVIAVVLINQLNGQNNYPANLPKCKCGDQTCAKTAVQTILTNFYSGNKDINLVPIDPLHLDYINTNPDDPNSGPQTITNFKVTDTDLIGLKRATVHNAEFIRKGNAAKGTIELSAPTVLLTGKYEINANILLLPVEGRGKYNVKLVNTFLQIKYIGKLRKDAQNNEYLKFDKFRARFNSTDGSIEFGNLFNGNRALGDSVNSFLTNNWSNVIQHFNKPLSKIFSDIFANVMQGVFNSAPFNQMCLA